MATFIQHTHPSQNLENRDNIAVDTVQVSWLNCVVFLCGSVS
jgi:hypothetical protein